MSRPTSPRPRKPRRRFSSASLTTQPPYHTDSRSFRTLHHEDLRHNEREIKTLIYSSLPPTPIQTSPSRPSTPITPALTSKSASNTPQLHVKPDPDPPFSLWDYLREELLATDFDSHQELKWERVSNFVRIPFAIEKIIGFGFILCLDSFLYTFTIMPIRFMSALIRFIKGVARISTSPLPPSQKADLLRMLLLIASVFALNTLTDASKVYHTIRGQDTIKLYVIFNALEIADRLCTSIGQDILDCLFSRSTLELLSRCAPVSSHSFRPFIYFFFATLYTVAHALIMVYQLLSLNVAINSYDHALLTLLVSNQFSETKSSVFKRFEKDNLFQITCADIVERFSLCLMLSIVAFRNLLELRRAEFELSEGFVLPKSFGWFGGDNVLWSISYPVLMVMLSEMFVDWLKHAFITKFNHIRPSVYERYIDVLCRDLATMTSVGKHRARKHSYVDQSPLVARRLGFASLPLAVVAILIGYQSVSPLLMDSQEDLLQWTFRSLSNADNLHYLKWGAMLFLFWFCLVVVKIIVGVNLLSYATRRHGGMQSRAAADAINDYGRDPIGEAKEEQEYNRGLKGHLDNPCDDATRTAEIGENPPNPQGGGSRKDRKERVKLENLTRYTMVKRIW